MYEPSRHIATFHIAGFQRYDGALALKHLKVGTKLKMVPEFDNPYDADAIALYADGKKLGYIPRTENEMPAMLMRFGHKRVYECIVTAVSRKAEPWKQVTCALRIKDARKHGK